MMPLVSILIPAYNAEPWIADTIRSALAQDWPRKEIVVVDDGSRDRTLAIAREFAGREVAVVTQENQGAAAARNRAYAACQGDYIQWLDADAGPRQDSERTRDACVRYLQTWMLNFCPERPDIVRQAEQLATELGGQLRVPRLSWKYDWVRRWFGWEPAKTMRLSLRNVRESLLGHWDRALARIEALAFSRKGQ
jgi:glycosyltransferase involved in cell wall biosynthesis